MTFGYGAIIDAGSSGSRIFLYRWPKNEDDTTTYTKVEQEALFSDERNTGGVTAERGIDMLAELLSGVKAALPSEVNLNEVPIFLGATAGMRKLDSASEAEIMANIRSLLHSSGFLFRDHWARTLSGEEEGAYGWLVANYLKGNGNLPEVVDTLGALDLGGSSTQISLVSTPKLRQTYSRFHLRIGKLNYPIFTHSYANLGADQARIQHDANFASPSPCYPSGFTEPSSSISGSSNWEECFNNVAKLFDKRSNLRRGEGNPFDAFHDIIKPPIDHEKRFLAMSVFVYVFDFLGLTTGAETADLNALKDRAGYICNLSYTEQTKQYDDYMTNVPPLERKTMKPWSQCFNAAYSYHLLSRGYGLPISDTPIEVYYDINGGKVQWALGMMLEEANKLERVYKKGGRLDGHGLDNTRLYLFGILAFLVLGYYFCLPRRVKRKFVKWPEQRGYSLPYHTLTRLPSS